MDGSTSLIEIFDVFYLTDIFNVLSLYDDKLVIIGYDTFDVMDARQKIVKKVPTPFPIKEFLLCQHSNVFYCFVLTENNSMYVSKVEDIHSDLGIEKLYCICEFKGGAKSFLYSYSQREFFYHIRRKGGEIKL